MVYGFDESSRELVVHDVNSNLSDGPIQDLVSKSAHGVASLVYPKLALATNSGNITLYDLEKKRIQKIFSTYEVRKLHDRNAPTAKLIRHRLYSNSFR